MAASTPWIILAVVGGGVVVDQVKRARTGYGLFGKVKGPSRADVVLAQADAVAATAPVPAGPENVGGTLQDILDAALGLVRGVGDIFRPEDVSRIVPGARRWEPRNGVARRVPGARRVTNGGFSPDVRRVPGGGRVGRPVVGARRRLRRGIAARFR